MLTIRHLIQILSYFTILLQECQSKKSHTPYYYPHQLIYHAPQTSTTNATHNSFRKRTWKQRYYVSDEFYEHPGPIFLIMGGEEAIEPEQGILFPFISKHLAQHFSALVVQLEHRFYGASQPLGNTDHVTNEDLIQLLTPEQAMLDAVQFIQYIRTKYKCATATTSIQKGIHYCPVITVGGSYPGFLSAMMRFLHPNIIDAAYAASAPMLFYAQAVEDQFAYYDLITKVADKYSPGCAKNVRVSLLNVMDVLAKEVISIKEAAKQMSLCFVPSYMQTDIKMFINEIMMVVGYTFANYNMANYPPNNETELYKACQIFEEDSSSFLDKLGTFFQPYWTTGSTKSCFDVSTQLPDGPNATISSGDWSGVGSQWSGKMWDFQTCSLLIERIGFSVDSMFPPRTWTVEWLTDHCQRRFQVTPQPNFLVNKWKFDLDSFVNQGASRILFTNGKNDGWSVSGIQKDLSSDVLALNFENGAHHSDLSLQGPSDRDTNDIKEGFIQIQNILERFIQNATLSNPVEQIDRLAVS